MLGWFLERSQHKNEESLEKIEFGVPTKKELWVQRQDKETSLMKQKVENSESYKQKQRTLSPMKHKAQDNESYKLKTKDIKSYET